MMIVLFSDKSTLYTRNERSAKLGRSQLVRKSIGPLDFRGSFPESELTVSAGLLYPTRQ